MVPFLARRWFLLLLLTGIGVALTRPGWLRPVLGPLEPRVVVGTALFLMACGLEGRRLVGAVRNPWAAVWAAAVSYGLVPPLACLAGLLMPEDLRAGLVLMSVVPCTLASAALWTRMAGGDEAPALLTVVLTTATSWLVTPAWLALLLPGGRSGTATAALMGDLALVLIVPLGLGQWLRRWPSFAAATVTHRRLLGVLAQLVILSIALKAAVGLRERLDEQAAAPSVGVAVGTAALCLGVHLAALTAAYGGGRLLGLGRAERIAAAFAGSQKTLPVALFLYATYYQADYPLAVFAIVCYQVGQLVADTWVAEALKGKPAPGEGPGQGQASA